MANILSEVYNTYLDNLKFVIFFSIPFVIAFLIPLFAPLPTYISSGGIFLRISSIFTNLNAINLVIILIAILFSLLFISFAFVLISMIVKAKKTRSKISKRVLQDIERYIGKVFIILLIYTFILIALGIIGYDIGYTALLTTIFGFFGFIPIFYAPSAIVVDNKGIIRAVKDSIKLVIGKLNYFVLWFVLISVIITVVDFIMILISGNYLSMYLTLIIVSLFVLPYFVIFQAEAYMRRFALLRH
ncbi:MAG: hypothetical protein ACP5M9_03605 [Candidatus Micrarchaeia archaeon]